jgi:RNA polymerase sigma factor (sigma-70 family)
LQHEIAAQEKVLVERLKLREAAAWEELHQLFSPQLRIAIRRHLQRRSIPLDRVDDVEQMVWRLVNERIHTFVYQEEGKFFNWIRTIALYCVRTLYHHEKRDHISLDAVPAATPDNPLSEDQFLYQNKLYTESAEDLAEISLHRAELRRKLLPVLDRALRELSARDRQIVVRYFINKEKPGELAEQFDLKIQNIYQIVYRAKKTMWTYLVAHGLFGIE